MHLLNDHSSYGRHSIYQKLAPLPKELQKSWGFPNQSELRGTWPVREEVIPLCDSKSAAACPEFDARLCNWDLHDEFVRPGAVRRCIVWCPVGIHLTEECKALQAERDRAES